MDINLSSSFVAEKLLTLEYPFLWKPRNDLESCPTDTDMIDRLTYIIDENLVDTELGIEMIVVPIILGYEYGIAGNVNEALKSLEIAEAELESALTGGSSNLFLKKVSTPLLYFILASKAHVLALKNELQEAYDVILKLPLIPPTNAALIGLRAVFYSYYGLCGMKMGLQFATKAINKNPEESLWYFWKGRDMGLIRKFEDYFAIPTQEEIELLQKALQLEEHPTYMIYCAIVCQHAAKNVTRMHGKQPEITASSQLDPSKLNSESLKLYKKCIELEPNSVDIIFLCAKGLFTLPRPFKDDVESKKLLKRGLDLAPDSNYGHHLMGLYYERREKNYELAVQHLKICEKDGSFGARLDLLRLEYLMDETTVDAVARLNQLLEDFPGKNEQVQVRLHLASYFIFAVPDLPKACEYIGAAVILDSNFSSFKYHRTLFLILYEPCNLFHIIVDEIKIRLRDHICPSEEREMYQVFLNQLHEIGVDIPTQGPQNLKQSFVDKSNACRRQFHGTQRRPQSESLFSRRPASTTQSNPQVLSWRRRP